MAAISGKGGTVYFTPYGETQEADLSISTWELDSTAIKAQVSPSGAGAGQRFLTENTYHGWTLSAPLDDGEFPDTLGLTEGQVFTSIYFSLGQAFSGTFQLYDKLAESLVETVNVVDDVNGALRLQVTGCGGAITRGVTA